jgi:Cytoplasmic Fragile-X interacting family
VTVAHVARMSLTSDISSTQATRYNYSDDEKSALAELVGMVKSIQSMMQRMQPILERAVYTHIYHQLQEFVHNVLSEPLRKADKHHKDIVKRYSERGCR